MADQRENALQYARSKKENFLSTFKEILAIPSISTDKAHIPDIQPRGRVAGCTIA